MEPEQVAQAADLLLQARRSGVGLKELPLSCRPTSAAEANAIIDAITAKLDEEIVGWKIGFLFNPRQVPFLCPLFASRVFASPARVPLSLVPYRRIEPEISFRLTADLPARAKAYQAEEVAEVVLACPSLEIVDTRFDTGFMSLRERLDDRARKIEAFADHITTGAFIVGEGRADWRDVDFAAISMRMGTPGRTIVETIGGHAFVDPFLPCVVLANTMRHRGGLKAGQVMVTGSFSGYFEVAADEPVTAEFVGFGSATATFVSGM